MNATKIHKQCIAKYRRHLMNIDEWFVSKCLITIKPVTVAYLMSVDISGAVPRVMKISV